MLPNFTRDGVLPQGEYALSVRCHYIPNNRKTMRWQVPPDPERSLRTRVPISMRLAEHRRALSLAESLVFDPMAHLFQHRLIPRIAPAEAIEPDQATVQVHLRPNQPVDPLPIHLEAPAQHLHRAGRIRTPQVDDPALQPGLQVQAPPLRERPPRGCRLDPIGTMAPQGGHVAARPILQAAQVGVLEPGPDLRLPGAVVVLDSRLEARLARRDEHRDHPQGQAQPADPADGVG